MVFGNLGDDQRHRRRVHPRPEHRRQALLRRVAAQRPGRGRGGRHPHAAADFQGTRHRGARPSKSRCRRAYKQLFAIQARSSRITSATCRTSSSPSRMGGSTCCRPATASARPGPRCKIAVDMVAEKLIGETKRCCASRPRVSSSCSSPRSIPRPRTRSSPAVCPHRPGAVTGQVVFSADEAERPRRQRRGRDPGAHRDLARRICTA